MRAGEGSFDSVRWNRVELEADLVTEGAVCSHGCGGYLKPRQPVARPQSCECTLFRAFVAAAYVVNSSDCGRLCSVS